MKETERERERERVIDCGSGGRAVVSATEVCAVRIQSSTKLYIKHVNRLKDENKEKEAGPFYK